MFLALTHENYEELYARFIESTDPNEVEFVGITHDVQIAKYFLALRAPAKGASVIVDVDEWLDWVGDMDAIAYFDEHPEDYAPRWIITALKEWDPEDEVDHDFAVEFDYNPFRVFA